MKHMFIIFSLLAVNLYAYSDADMDGVDDLVDRCPNTSMTELVDISGCTVKSLVSLHHYDIILGASYGQTDYNTNQKTDTLTATSQIDYYYKNFSLQASTSYYSADNDTYSDSGMNDSILAAYYQFRLTDALLLRLGAGVILPTYDTTLNNNNTDYIASASLSYALGNVNIFGSYAYTQVNDDDVNTADIIVNYQNTNAYNAGIGYYMSSKLYSSLAYNAVDSLYKEVETIETVSLYNYYRMDEHWFTTLSYAYGLSDSASKHYLALRLGYYF